MESYEIKTLGHGVNTTHSSFSFHLSPKINNLKVFLGVPGLSKVKHFLRWLTIVACTKKSLKQFHDRIINKTMKKENDATCINKNIA